MKVYWVNEDSIDNDLRMIVGEEGYNSDWYNSLLRYVFVEIRRRDDEIAELNDLLSDIRDEVSDLKEEMYDHDNEDC